MTRELMQRELVIDLPTGEFQVLPIIDPRIIGPADYAWIRFSEGLAALGDPPAAAKVMTWGGGPLAASRIPGTRRLVFGGYSPSWEGFYLSSLGGGAHIMHRIGADFVCIRGAAPEDSVLILNHTRGQISVRLEPIDPDAIWTGHAGRHPRSARAGTGREGGGDGEKVGGWDCRSRRSPKSQRTSIVMQVSVRKISDD